MSIDKHLQNSPQATLSEASSKPVPEQDSNDAGAESRPLTELLGGPDRGPNTNVMGKSDAGPRTDVMGEPDRG